MFLGESLPDLLGVGFEFRGVSTVNELDFVVGYNFHIFAELIKLKFNILNSFFTLDGVDIFRENFTEELSDLFWFTFDGSPVFFVLNDLLILNLDKFLHIDGGLLEVGITLEKFNEHTVVFFLIDNEFRLLAVNDGPLFHFLTFNQLFVLPITFIHLRVKVFDLQDFLEVWVFTELLSKFIFLGFNLILIKSVVNCLGKRVFETEFVEFKFVVDRNFGLKSKLLVCNLVGITLNILLIFDVKL